MSDTEEPEGSRKTTTMNITHELKACAYNVGSKVQVFFAKITPELAKALMEQGANRGNRSPKQRQIEKLVRDLVGGRFKLNGQALIFSVDGRVLDGQHRLLACIESGVPFVALVVTGIEEEAMNTIDTIAARTKADQMKIAFGVSSEATATAQQIERFTAQNLLTAKDLSSAEIKAVVDAWEADILWAITAVTRKIENPEGASGSARTWAAFAFCRCLNPARVDQLAEDFRTGNSVNATAVLMRNHVSKLNKNKATKYEREKALIEMLHGIVSYVDNDPVMRLRVANHADYLKKVVERVENARGVKFAVVEEAPRAKKRGRLPQNLYAVEG